MADITLYNNAQELVKTESLGIDQLIELFLQSNDVRPSSKATYAKSIKPFFAWVDKNNLLLKDISRVNILQFKEDLLTGGLSSGTVNSYLTAVRKFYDFVETIKLYPNVARGIKGAKCRKQFKKQPLSPNQGKTLVLHIQGQSLRDFAIINLLIRTGLRTIELIRANVQDIVFKGDKRVLLIQGKGRDEKDSFVMLTDKTFQPIEKYLKSRHGVKQGDPLFTCISNSNKGGRLTTKSISRIAKNNLRGIGLDSHEFTAHSLRHTAAVNMLRAGGTIKNAQDMLRHTSADTTNIYTQTINEEMRLKNAPEALLDKMY